VDRDQSKLDRRKFLERTGATAGGLWLASEIVTMPTAFAGASCVLTGSTLGASNWQNFSWPASGSFPALSLSTTVGTIGAPVPNTGSGTFTAPLLVGYGIPNQRVFYFDFNDADGTASGGEGGSVTFTFSAPVFNLAFRTYDIDRNTTGGQNYIDRVTVTATGGATVSGTSPGGSPSGNGTVGNPFIGTTTNNTSTTASYGDYTLSGRVTSFTLTYTNGIPAGDDGTRMIMGIGDLSFCR
jgi:hypothetical protein